MNKSEVNYKENEEFYVYHVVTERELKVGQHIFFDGENLNGVGKRVNEKKEIVEDIYKNPQAYKIEKLEHHTKVALRELALEKVRKEKFSNYPSRMSCLYVSDNYENAETWSSFFVEWKRPTFSIVRLKVKGRKFIGDAFNCFEATTNEEENCALAENYWLNKPNPLNKPPLHEFLVDGEIEVVEILKVINKNM